MNEGLPEGAARLFDEEAVVHVGEARAERGVAGKASMGLDAGQFSAPANPNYRSVTFVVEDGFVEIKPIPVVVTVMGSTNEVDYDGNAHTAAGYSASADVNEGVEEGRTPVFDLANIMVTGSPSAVRTDAGTTNMGLSPAMFRSADVNNFSSVTFVVTDGFVTVNPIPVEVAVTGHTSTMVYDGKRHAASGFDAVASTPLYRTDEAAPDFAFAGSAFAARTTAGKTRMGLEAAQFSNANPNFSTVTFTVEDGYQVVEPASVKVLVSGASDAVTYNGREQAISGFSTWTASELYDLNDVMFSGQSRVARTDVGTSAMGLEPGQFQNNNSNFDVTFEVNDGFLTVSPVDKVTVVITGATAGGVYDGQEHVARGFDFSASSGLYTADDFEYDGDAQVARTHAGTSFMELNPSLFRNVNYAFANVEFIIASDGFVDIQKANAQVIVTGAQAQAVYDGAVHSADGYQISADTDLYIVNPEDGQDASFEFTGAGTVAETDAGLYAMGLQSSDFRNVNPDFDQVEFRVVDGELRIDPAQTTVMVKGHQREVTYNGAEQTSEGLDLQIENDLLAADDVVYNGEAVARGVASSDQPYEMGLDAGQFTCTNPNFEVTFDVQDGSLTIAPVEAFRARWLRAPITVSSSP